MARRAEYVGIQIHSTHNSRKRPQNRVRTPVRSAELELLFQTQTLDNKTNTTPRNLTPLRRRAHVPKQPPQTGPNTGGLGNLGLGKCVIVVRNMWD